MVELGLIPLLSSADATKLRKALPAHLRDVFAIAHGYGIREGQLTRTRRRFVDLTRGVIAWPPDECKQREAHTMPLEARGCRSSGG